MTSLPHLRRPSKEVPIADNTAPRMMREAPQTAPVVVDIDAISKSFGKRPVLEQVSLQVRQGEFLALLGPSGSGKSTLLRLINGIHPADAGRVTTLGVDPQLCRRHELRLLRTQVGFVFQDFGLVQRLSAIENVLMGALGALRLPRYGITSYPRSVRQEAVEHLERVGLADRRFQRCGTLSGGQQQRVAIARTLMQGPRLILADEPVASLDPASSRVVMRTLRRLCDEDGITVVCSLHQLELALKVPDRVVALADKRVAIDAATSAVTAEALHAVFGSDDEELDS
jgi:phosphonate transport system ATP-binding protein